MSKQLTLDLPTRESRTRGNFFISEANQIAVARLEQPDTWPNRKLVLYGPEGAGKSHLAAVWRETEGAALYDISEVPDITITDEQGPVIVDISTLPMSQSQEEALFHLHNHMGASGYTLLLLARVPPALWEIELPDLKSRMEATDTVQISEPDDALLSAVLLKLFADRQVQVAPNLISWLVSHMDRSFAEAQRHVDQLDRRALAEGRAITRSFAAEVLDIRD